MGHPSKIVLHMNNNINKLEQEFPNSEAWL